MWVPPQTKSCQHQPPRTLYNFKNNTLNKWWALGDVNRKYNIAMALVNKLWAAAVSFFLTIKFAEPAVSSSYLQCATDCTDNCRWIILILNKNLKM